LGFSQLLGFASQYRLGLAIKGLLHAGSGH
jgi:hypothetical protein